MTSSISSRPAHDRIQLSLAGQRGRFRPSEVSSGKASRVQRQGSPLGGRHGAGASRRRSRGQANGAGRGQRAGWASASAVRVRTSVAR